MTRLPAIFFEYPSRHENIEKNLLHCIEFIGREYFQDIDAVIFASNEYFVENLVDKNTEKLVSTGFQLSGLYSSGSEIIPARIYINFDCLYLGIPKLLKFPPLIAFRLLKILAHELAHHLIEKQKEPFDKDISQIDEEQVTEKFAEETLSKYKSKRKFWAWINKEISSWYFYFGVADYKAEDYKSAMRKFYLAWLIDCENEQASEWFWLAKAKTENLDV